MEKKEQKKPLREKKQQQNSHLSKSINEFRGLSL